MEIAGNMGECLGGSGGSGQRRQPGIRNGPAPALGRVAVRNGPGPGTDPRWSADPGCSVIAISGIGFAAGTGPRVLGPGPIKLVELDQLVNLVTYWPITLIRQDLQFIPAI